MLNFIPNGVSFVGIGLLVAGVMLFLLRQYRPSLARDHDIFFAAIALVTGLIFIVYGWKFDPLMQFATVMLTASSIFFAVESIRLRGITTAQAKEAGGEPIIDDDRPVSRAYRAELDDYDDYRYDDRNSRRMRGSRERWDEREPRRLDAYVDDRDYYDAPRREPVGRLRPSDRDAERERAAAPPARSRRPARAEYDRGMEPTRERDYPERDYYDEPMTSRRDRYPAPPQGRDQYSDERRERYDNRDRPVATRPPARREQRAIRPSRPERPAPVASASRERRWDSLEDEPAAPYRPPQSGLTSSAASGSESVQDVDYRPVDEPNASSDRPPLEL